MKQLLVKDHTLLLEGRVCGPRYGGKVGYGRCSCGGRSPELQSNAARKRWHREHKLEILKEVRG